LSAEELETEGGWYKFDDEGKSITFAGAPDKKVDFGFADEVTLSDQWDVNSSVVAEIKGTKMNIALKDAFLDQGVAFPALAARWELPDWKLRTDSASEAGGPESASATPNPKRQRTSPDQNEWISESLRKRLGGSGSGGASSKGSLV